MGKHFKTPEYGIWSSMRTRCRNPNYHQYSNYGGRGISVCDRWNDFSAFLADMGQRPEGLTLERIDNDGNYEPRNCHWATRRDQNNNRRSNRMVTFRGNVVSLGRAMELAGSTASWSSVYGRIFKRGWDVERAVTTPALSKEEIRELQRNAGRKANTERWTRRPRKLKPREKFEAELRSYLPEDEVQSFLAWMDKAELKISKNPRRTDL